MKQENFITHKPKNSFLRDYIAYYYFHSCTTDSIQKKFIYYPGYKNALTIYRNATVEFGLNYSSVEPDKETDVIFLYSGVQKHFRTAYILSPFDKIGIVFRELGINHFIDGQLANLSNHPIDKSFDHFGEDITTTFKAIYAKETIDEKIKLLDQIFDHKFRGFREELLKESVDLIIHSSNKLQVKELSAKLNVSRRTLLRLFKKHLCCSVKDYIDIVQFRKSLDDYLLKNKVDSLTSLAHRNDYYDQSQFIHHFKKMAGVNPNDFFGNIDHIGQEDTYWTFL